MEIAMTTSSTANMKAPPRVPVHSRAITCDCFLRPDGLWDLEARVEDRKHYDLTLIEQGMVPAQAPYHSIGVKLTVDDELRIVAAEGDMRATPFADCVAAVQPLQALVGATLGRGWRKTVDDALARASSCTHMREMLYTIASSAIQAIPGYRYQQVPGHRWPNLQAATDKPPSFIGGCLSWRQDGPVVMRHYPQFFRRQS
jgi:hypothetical protein